MTGERIAFLYLDTGYGHVSPARALAGAMEERYPGNVQSFLKKGFSEHMRYSRFFFEDGYRLTSNAFESAYVTFYRFTQCAPSIEFGNYLISLQGVSYLANFLRTERITKVVCLHEVLILMTRNAINRVDPAIPLITIVTDPFTAHALWFYEKNTDLVVFSRKLRDEAVNRWGFPADRIYHFPFILSRENSTRPTAEESALFRKRLGIPEGKKVLLIAGGGEGLKGADKIVSCFAKASPDMFLLVVCGRDLRLKRRAEKIVHDTAVANIMVFGFVDFMHNLLNIADCVITKGGASLLMETLAAGKPVIFSTFIRGQELGNVLYTVYNGAGWLIRKPELIIQKAVSLLGNPEALEQVQKNVERIRPINGLDDIAEFIYNRPRTESRIR